MALPDQLGKEEIQDHKGYKDHRDKEEPLVSRVLLALLANQDPLVQLGQVDHKVSWVVLGQEVV